MVRHRDEEKRLAILEAAAIVVAEQGLGAPTAKIAKTAGLADGTLFVYFPTKTVLFNELYVALKKELTSIVLASLPTTSDLRTQLLHVWTAWTTWGVEHPAKRRALAQLTVSDQITAASRAKSIEHTSTILALVMRVSASGTLGGTSVVFIGALMEAMATATMDFMAREPDQAQLYCSKGFAAVWAAFAGFNVARRPEH